MPLPMSDDTNRTKATLTCAFLELKLLLRRSSSCRQMLINTEAPSRSIALGTPHREHTDIARKYRNFRYLMRGRFWGSAKRDLESGAGICGRIEINNCEYGKERLRSTLSDACCIAARNAGQVETLVKILTDARLTSH